MPRKIFFKGAGKMLSKKNLFNLVYAVAFVGAITSCVGILSELFNIAQLKGVYIHDLANFQGEIFSKPFTFYLIAFLISAVAVVCLILRWVKIIKISSVFYDIILLLCCIALLVMSFCTKGLCPFVQKVRLKSRTAIRNITPTI